MTLYKIAIITFISLTVVLKGIAQEQSKPRVIVMTDGEVDDRSSMVRFLLYTNDVKVEAIIQTNSVYQRNGWSSSKWLDRQIDAYGQVYPNLIVHDASYPSPESLKSKIFIGDEDSSHLIVNALSNSRMPGMEPVIDPSRWRNTPGSDRIVEVLLEDDSDPVYIQAWGGGNTAARAFYVLKTEYPDKYEKALSKVVMYNIWYQDGAGNYIEKYFPEVIMLISYNFSGSWAYGSQGFTHSFVENDIKKNHGPLGALYPQDYISEGDSPAFLYVLGNGLRGYENPTWGGWGGRFYKVEGVANVYRDWDRGSYLKWVEYANRDFQARLQWCVSKKFQDANHRPQILVNESLNRTVKSGELVEIEAKLSDPDSINTDELWRYNSNLYTQAGLTKERFEKMAKNWEKTLPFWWQDKVSGTYDGWVKIDSPYKSIVKFIAPNVDIPKTIHLILEVKDRGVPALTSFRRIVFTVLPD